MALFSLLRRLCIVLQLIGLFSSVPGTIKKVYAVANVPISGPDIKFVLLPPSKVIISQKHTPVLLPCSASVKNEIVKSSIFEFPFYLWLRNDEPLITRKNEFQIFENGTLEIFFGDKAAGSYRCLANATEIDAGVLLSTESIVEAAVLKSNRSRSNITATIGEAMVLQCPIFSIPKANISWLFDNESTNSKFYYDRFLYLKSGGILIKNVTITDQGKFKCIAKNSYVMKGQKQFTWTVSVKNSSTQKKSGLLPPLQNETEYIEAGSTLKLHCASYSEDIEWWFTPRSQRNPTKISNHSNEIDLKHVTVNQNDGFYRCSTKFDYQDINVIITTRPLIEPRLESWESSIAAQVPFICNATGNPAPSISWFRNGVRLKNSLTTNYIAPTLRINSVDLKDEGIYQCFAKNIAGETVDSSVLSLRRKDELPNMPNRPENIACYPVSYTTVFVIFSGSPTLSLIHPYIVTQDPFNWKTLMPIPLVSNSNLTINEGIPLLKPFVLFMRGLVPTSTQTTNGLKQQTFDVSLLSEGIKCSTQGLAVNGIFLESSIYIWWTPLDEIIAEYYIIQFCNKDNKDSITINTTIVGTTHPINFKKITKEDIDAMLFKMPVLNKTHSRDGRIRKKLKQTIDSKQNFRQYKETDRNSQDSDICIITEVHVPGNVTGILIPNAQKIKVRVLLITAENEYIKQNLKYVKWKTIENTTSNHNFVFRVSNIESRSIAISWNPIDSISCIRACCTKANLELIILQTQPDWCQDITGRDIYFVVRKLMPATFYRMSFMDCFTSQDFGSIDVQTKQDAPGPITNQKITKNDGLKLSWDPPVNPNGQILYYIVLWTVHNFTYNANVTEGVNSFQFPNVTEDDKINITIRAIGSSGIGLPIYIDLKYIKSEDFGKEKSSSDPTLGVIVGIILSMFCVVVFIWIFIQQRGRFKSRACSQSSTSPTDLHCTQKTSSNIELREMQTLIPKIPDQNVNSDIEGLPRNGIYYCEPDEETETAENVQDISNAICSSTPKITRKQDLSETLLQENNLLPAASIAATTLLNKNSSSPNFSISKLHSNGNSTKYLNGSIKLVLPPYKHSIAVATSEPKLLKVNGNLKITDDSQYSIVPNSNASILDNSHHKLLDTKLDSDIRNEFNDSNNHNHPKNHQLNDSTSTTTTTVDMDDSIRSYNPIEKNNWNYRRPIVDPNG